MLPTCNICCSDICDSDQKLELTCGHTFHTKCIIEWFRCDHEAHGSCPACRDCPETCALKYTSLSVTLAHALIRSAKRGKVPRVVRDLVSKYDSTKRARQSCDREMKEFNRKNIETLKTHRTLLRRHDSLIRKQTSYLRALCRVHPVIPSVVHIVKDGEDSDAS
jgi:hypothetical protein